MNLNKALGEWARRDAEALARFEEAMRRMEKEPPLKVGDEIKFRLPEHAR